ARVHSVLEILVLKALALHAGSALPAALETLTEALRLAQPEGYVRLFLDEGVPMLTLLSQVSKTDPFLHGYVQQLLTHAHVTRSSLISFTLSRYISAVCHVTKDVAIADSSSITHYTLQYPFGHMTSGPLGRTLAA